MSATLKETQASADSPLSLFVIPSDKDKPMVPIVPGARLPAQTDSVLHVGWCLPDDEVKQLQDAGVVPYVLLVVSHNGREKSRQIVLLKDGGAFVRFASIGVNKLHANVVWRTGGADSPKHVLTKKNDNGLYRTDVLEATYPMTRRLDAEYEQVCDELDALRRTEPVDDDEVARLNGIVDEKHRERQQVRATELPVYALRRFDSLHQLEGEFVHEFDLPREMFGDNLAITKWVASIIKWRRRPMEECDVRRRALVTLPILPFYMLFMLFKWTAMLTVLVGGVLIVGLRSPNLGALLNPRKNNFDNLFGYRATSVWFKTKNKQDRDDPLFIVNPLTISIAMMLAGLISMVASLIINHGHHAGPYWVGLWHNWWMYAVGAGVPVAICTAVVVFGVVAGLFGYVGSSSIVKNMLAARKQKASAKAEAAKLKAKNRAEREIMALSVIACGKGPTAPAPVAAVRRQHTPTVLSYTKLKAKLCRPLPS